MALTSTTGLTSTPPGGRTPGATSRRSCPEMTALGAQHGFRVFLVAIPFGDQLRSDYVARNRDYVMYPQRKLAEITRRLDIPYLDLYPVLDLARDFESDHVHLSKRGRALAGERIAQFLMDERLVPSAT